TAGVHERNPRLEGSEDLLIPREGVGQEDLRAPRTLGGVALLAPDARKPTHVLENPAPLREEEGEHERNREHAAHHNPEAVWRIDEGHPLSTHREYPGDEAEREEDKV